MGSASSLRFATAARVLTNQARAQGLLAPGFRSPPGLEGVDRTVRRRLGGPPTVAVRVRGRAWPTVVNDMIEGVVAVNKLSGPGADRVRGLLWEAIETAESSRTVSGQARVA